MAKARLPFKPEVLEQVMSILDEVGLTRDYGFDTHAQSVSNYMGGVFEWTERFKGSRFYLNRDYGTGKVTKVRVINHPDPQGPHSEEFLADVNERLALALAKN